ncbi:MAG: hypothetical protein SV375_16525 [Thermodesulfobacteriota bacterium]|nr:hypothetical protein [Thermodesulfobacteriota bacterium]
MAAKSLKYERLRGKKKSFLFGYHTLWLSNDHLLSIDSRRFMEDYKRFYLRDIQSIIIQKTSVGKIQNLFLAVFCCFFILLTYSTRGIEVLSVILGIITFLFLLALLINWFRGPTCVCHIQTAVQTEKLPSLNRLKTAQKAMERLRPLIENVQGTLTPEMLREKMQEGYNQDTRSSRGNAIPLPLRHEHGPTHGILFYLLLSDGLFTFMDLFYNHIIITLASTGISMGTGICVIIALVKQHGSDMKTAIRSITWGVLGYVILAFFVSYIIHFIIAIKNPGIMHNQWDMIKKISALSPSNHPWLMGLYIFSICVSFTLGISGLILLRKFKQEHKLYTDIPDNSSGVTTPLRGQ